MECKLIGQYPQTLKDGSKLLKTVLLDEKSNIFSVYSLPLNEEVDEPVLPSVLVEFENRVFNGKLAPRAVSMKAN